MKISWKTLLLWTLPLLVVGFFLWQGTFSPNTGNLGNNTANTRMTYGRFLEYLDADRVQSVDLYEGGRTAIVQVTDPELADRTLRSRGALTWTAHFSSTSHGWNIRGRIMCV